MQNGAGFDVGLFEVLETGVALFDHDFRLMSCNSAFANLLGRQAASLQRSGRIDDLLSAGAVLADRRVASAGLAETLRRNASADFEIVLPGRRHLRLKSRPTETGAYLVSLEDRSEEAREAAALRASEERYDLVVQATSDGIYDWNVAEDMLYVSDNLNQLLQFDLSRKASKMWADRVHPEDLPRYAAATRAHLKGESEALECEYRVRGPNGSWLWVQDRGVGQRDAQGRVSRLVGAVRDITAIREAQAEIGRVEARLIASLSTISDGILLCDPEGRVLLWNERYVEIFSAAAGADISGIVIAGRPALDMFRDGYEMGMFKPFGGGVEAWIEVRRKGWERPAASWELELSNGMWILINERRMPDGGRICSYTDVTGFKRREAEAEAARARFEDAIEALSSGFALFDADDRLMIWNTPFQNYFSEMADVFHEGVRFSEMIAESIRRGLFPKAEGDVEGFTRRLLDRRGRGEVRENYLSSGVWLQIRDHRTSDGGLVSIYTDITELKQREEEALTARRRFEEAIEAISSGFVLWDGEDRLVTCNSRYPAYFQNISDLVVRGARFDEIMRQFFARGLMAEVPDDIEAAIAAINRTRRTGGGQARVQHLADGTWLQITDHRTADGGLVSIYTDISELKRQQLEIAEQSDALQATLAELNAVLDNIDYGILFMDADLRARVVNRAFAAMWNIPPEFIEQGRTMRELIEYSRQSGVYDIPEGEIDGWIDQRLASIRAGGITRDEFKRADGRVMATQCVALPDGGRMLTYFDITEMKRREREILAAKDEAERALTDLRRAQERLVQAEKMASLGQLTAGIAHEIKNPLNFVNNFSRLSVELLGELEEILAEPIAALGEDERADTDELMEMIRGNLRKIDEHGRRADSIVKNMLLHARDAPSEPQVVNANALLSEALNLAYHGARAERPGFNIAMREELDPDAGQIEAYPQDLMRVFLNLISNGIYAADRRRAEGESGFEPEIAIATRAGPGGIEVEIADNGTGIPEQIREKIFEPFFTTKPAGEGTGLGLSLSYDIVVKQHGGRFELETEPGQFTRFRVLLNRALARADRVSP